jgi:integrase
MPRRKSLSDAAIAKLSSRPKPYTVPDPGLSGHYVRVRPTGAKVFVAVARAPNGKQVWHTIGASTLYDIEEAREKAREAIKAIKSGGSRDGVETFEAVAEQWLKRHVEAKGLISAPDIRSYLARYLVPSWAGREFSSIRRGDVAKLLDSVEDSSGPIAADYVLSVIRGLCNWYAARHENYSSPIVRGMRRTDPKARARARILDDDELRTLWAAAEANGTFGAFVRVALLTGQRREKVLAMRWEDISADGEWHIPTAKREKGTAGSLVLPQAAIDIIQAQPRFVGNAHVFAGIGSNPIGGMSKRKAQFEKQAGIAQNWTIHDLRRTARSLMSRADVRPDIAERVLGHAIQGVEGVYDRHSYREEKAHALKALAGLIDNILRPESAKVTRLRG